MNYGHVKIGNVVMKAAIPTTMEGKRSGMMGARFNSGFQCMVFQFKDVRRSFWMKNCIIPLDMIFVLDGVVSSIEHMCPPCTAEETVPAGCCGLHTVWAQCLSTPFEQPGEPWK